MSAGGRPCPRCGAALPAGAEAAGRTFPFCSPRCKLVDLAKWMSGSYRIPGEPIGAPAEPGQAHPGAPEDDGSMPSA